jgi:hypothetical protein
MLGPVLVSLHNIRFYQRLMLDVGGTSRAGTFAQFLRNDPRCRIGPREGSTPKVDAADTRETDDVPPGDSPTVEDA